MNTIPSIFNERQLNRTVLWGKGRNPDVKLNVSVILLNHRGSSFRLPMLENLAKCGFEQIVSIEGNADNYNIDDFSHRFPFVKFIIPLESATTGELINLGMSEVSTEYVLVLHDSIKIGGELLSQQVTERLTQQNIFCFAPRLSSDSVSSFPQIFTPAVNGPVFKIDSTSIISDGCETLYPLDFMGLYNRKKFIQLGGYDYTIKSPHWQNVDFCFRAWLWGEKIRTTTFFTLTYSESYPVEDVTPDLSYSRFYLKNLLPHFDEDHGVIPKSSIFVYLLRSGCGLIESLKQFFDARSWVKKNMYRFKIDAKYLVENWGNIK